MSQTCIIREYIDSEELNFIKHRTICTMAQKNFSTFVVRRFLKRNSESKDFQFLQNDFKACFQKKTISMSKIQNVLNNGEEYQEQAKWRWNIFIKFADTLKAPISQFKVEQKRQDYLFELARFKQFLIQRTFKGFHKKIIGEAEMIGSFQLFSNQKILIFNNGMIMMNNLLEMQQFILNFPSILLFYLIINQQLAFFALLFTIIQLLSIIAIFKQVIIGLSFFNRFCFIIRLRSESKISNHQFLQVNKQKNAFSFQHPQQTKSKINY